MKKNNITVRIFDSAADDSMEDSLLGTININLFDVQMFNASISLLKLIRNNSCYYIEASQNWINSILGNFDCNIITMQTNLINLLEILNTISIPERKMIKKAVKKWIKDDSAEYCLKDTLAIELPSDLCELLDPVLYNPTE